jgi:hypothetical protein
MQPYFFPYIGYFQLIAQSDVFVLHDDVQYIKGGWVNRNRILLNGEVRLITLPVQKDAYHLPINARHYVEDQRARKDILNLVRQAYMKAPRFSEVFPLIEDLLMFGDTNVARFNENLIRKIATFMGISTRIINSSEMEKDNALAGEPRVIEICRCLGGTDYTNPEGGQALYDSANFRDAGISLRFLVMRPVPYSQTGEGFVPYLSIMDMLFSCGLEAIKRYLSEYDLIEHSISEPASQNVESAN